VEPISFGLARRHTVVSRCADRRTLAAENEVPDYVVFGDRSLADMAARRPSTPEGLLACRGVGAAKLARYDEPFLAVIARE